MIFPAEKTPTLGLLAGSISVYWAQFVFSGAITGQSEFDSIEIFETELPSPGMVAVKVAPPGRENVCKADTEASTVAAADPVVAVTNP